MELVPLSSESFPASACTHPTSISVYYLTINKTEQRYMLTSPHSPCVLGEEYLLMRYNAQLLSCKRKKRRGSCVKTGFLFNSDWKTYLTSCSIQAERDGFVPKL